LERLNIYKEFTTNHSNLTNKKGTGDRGLGNRFFVRGRCVGIPHSPFPIPHSLRIPLALVFLFLAFPAFTQSPQSQGNSQFLELFSQSAVVMDATTGTIVYYKNPDDEIPPASLTKLMTMHLVFKEIALGRASLSEMITPPRESWAVNQLPGSSLMYLAQGQTLSLRELILGMAVISGNDAAAAAALRFAPTVDDFIGIMNTEAANMGLNITRFVDASGYSEENMTTARELAELCRIYLQAHPESLEEFHSVKEFSYPRAENVPPERQGNPGTRLRKNNNNLLGRVEGVDGLKTGYIPESGYNIALTAERNGTRFIAVILGAPSEWGGDRKRDEDGEKLLEWAFERYKTIRPDIGDLLPVRIWKGKDNYASIVPEEPLDFTALAERGNQLYWETELEEPIVAPLYAGQKLGSLVIYDSLGELRRITLVASQNAERGGFFKRLFDSIKLFLNKIFR
jgi:serine-type D-Ala-D-Ala carboxypeptidase (penicillin-binding protein 5/6)